MWLILLYLSNGCLAIQPSNTPQYRPSLGVNEHYPSLFPAPDPQYKEDPLPGLPDNLKEYLKLDFGQGYYEPKCNNPEIRPYIEPVYYWPGDTIKLKCRVCEEEQANNGKIKNWAFLDRKIAGKIDKLYLTIKNKNWLPIQQLHTEPPRLVLTPEFIFSSAIPIHRPNPHVYQRDGFLIITNSVAATYGLYRCFDYDKTDNLDYIYYLIPYTPILVDTANQRTIRPEYEILERESYRHFDEYHRWRIYPTFIQDKKNGICAGECNDKYLDVSKIKTPVTQWKGPVIHGHDDKKLTHKINLEVYVKWDNWTSCENGMDLQTRVGQCYLRKTRSSEVLKRDLDPLSGKEKHVLGEVEYALTLHRLLENVPAFKQDGFPLFTGILMDAMLPKNDPFDVSTKIPAFEWQSFYDLIIKGLLENSVRKIGNHGSSTELGPCLRKRGSSLFILNSHILFQNRKCK